MKQLKNYKTSTHEDTTTPESEFEHAKEKYGNMEEDALIEELKKQISEQKNSGSYSAAQMHEIVRYLTPYLSEAQKNKIESIIGSESNE